MGHIYTASFTGVSITALQDLFQLLASATVPIIIHSIRLGQTSDAGDAQAELLSVQMLNTTMIVDGSGGSSSTPEPHSPGSPAAVTVAEVNNTVLSTVTTVIISDTWNVQAPYLYQPTPEERITILPTKGFVFHLVDAPDDAIICNGSITFEEIK